MNYLIIGDDAYIRENEAVKIKKKFLSEDETNLNYSVCTPDKTDQIMDSVGTMPFLSEKRVVLVKEAQDLPVESIEAILSYLANPMDTSVLVLSASAAFKKNKNYRKLSPLMSVVSADKPSPGTARNWVRAFFKKENIAITPEAMDLIVELKGADTTGMKGELEKLVSFSNGKEIDVEVVGQLVGRNVTETVFKLVDAINARDAKWAFRVLNDLYDQKEEPHKVIGYLSWYIRVIQKIVLLSSRGIGPEGIASELGYSPGYVRRLSSQAKKYSVKRVGEWVNLLLETDRDIKTGRRSAALAVEMLLASLIDQTSDVRR